MADEDALNELNAKALCYRCVGAGCCYLLPVKEGRQLGSLVSDEDSNQFGGLSIARIG
jgi:hypothetical protein